MMTLSTLSGKPANGGASYGGASYGGRGHGRAEICVDGAFYPLRLTLGGLADLEAALGGGDFAGLKTRLAAPRAADLLTILHILMIGGGASMSLATLKASDLDLADASKAIAQAFAGLNAAASTHQQDLAQQETVEQKAAQEGADQQDVSQQENTQPGADYPGGNAPYEAGGQKTPGKP